MNDLHRPLADVMAEVSDTLHQPVAVPDLLNVIIRAARDNIPGVDHAGVSFTRTGGRIETVASTDPIVREIDELQYSLREGPCVDAIQTRQQTWSSNLSTDPRWPRFGPAASELGIESQMGLALFDEPDMIGGLNLYASGVGAFSEETPHIAAVFATHAAHALGRRVNQTQLNEALTTRRTIGIAIGLLMERYEMNEHRAFQFLIRTSQTGNVKLRDVAAEIVEQANQRNA